MYKSSYTNNSIHSVSLETLPVPNTIAKMPKVSSRKQAIKDLYFMWLYSRIQENQSNLASLNGIPSTATYGSIIFPNNVLLSAQCNRIHGRSALYLRTLLHTMNSRYLGRPLAHLLHPGFNMEWLFSMRDDDFKQSMRTSKEGFHFIYNKIKDHQVFKNSSNSKQVPISHQLALTLERLGSNGNAGSVGKFARNFNVGRGTVISISRRVLEAINSYEKYYIQWPNQNRRYEISQVMRQEGFEECVGFIDGTNFPLYQKPAWQGEVFFDRKKVYSINAQILCDCDKNITAIIAGWPGSCADAMVYRNMGIYRNPRRFFDKGQYLLLDSAYPLTDHLLPAFKAPASNLQINSDFNFCLAKSRVRNKHTIGILKGRWASLKQMRLQLNGQEDINLYVAWIKACCILHNMLANIKDSWDDLSEAEKHDPPTRYQSEAPSPSAEELMARVKATCV
ncbi:hypothetical protein O181_028002 [Austropuccinia psidii MF-1]|uniref:DDE Tnp4 domain-containing protein n=1 Tax=Austropuccinia psidii MF-1 TaxID=1389203 RepID=A0A9Q3CR16_9BASI|nr:hypothetical protein [Austropuccinia psidii MF-1]